MKDLKFRVWHQKENRMYYRGYQKFLHVLLCEDDGGPGRPIRRAGYGDCDLMESTGLLDKNGREIFEKDIVRVRCVGAQHAAPIVFEGIVGPVPDMFGSRKLHPLGSLLKANGIIGTPENLEIEIIGNEYASG